LILIEIMLASNTS